MTLKSAALRTARERSLLSAAVSGIGLRVVSGVCGLVQIPVVLRYLGTEGFGYWTTLTYLAALVQVADLGLGNGLHAGTAEAFGRECARDMVHLFKTCTMVAVLLASTLSAVAVGGLGFDWGHVFGLKESSLLRDADGAAVAVLIGSAWLIPFSLVGRFATAVQAAWINNLWQAAGSVVGLLVALFSYWNRLPFVIFAVLMQGAAAVTAIATLLVLRRRFPCWDSVPWWPDWRQVGPLLRRGTVFFIPQVSAAVVSALPGLWVSAALGAKEVATFQLAQKLLSLPQQVLMAVIAPYWPAYAEAFAREDMCWVECAYRRTLWTALVVGILPSALFALFGSHIISLWTARPSAEFDALVILSTSTWYCVYNWAIPYSAFLNGIGRLAWQAVYGPVSVAVAALGMAVAVPAMGVAGAPVSLAGSFLLINNAATWVDARIGRRQMDPRL